MRYITKTLLEAPKTFTMGVTFIRNKAGATAVEFALLVLPFFALMFSTFEVGWFYFVNSQLDAASAEAARLIRTGQAQKAGYDKQAFFDHMCPYLSKFGDCNSHLTIEVDTFATYAELAADTSAATCRSDDPQDVLDAPYNPGAQGAIVRLRFCMIYNTINPAIGVNVSDASNGTRRLYSNFLFKNEPYN